MQKRGIVVLGVSTDSVDSHKQFAEKYGLSFLLLSDTDASVSQRYGVYGEKNMYGKKYMGVNRETFLIDKDGVVRKVWNKVKPDEHASEVLEEVNRSSTGVNFDDPSGIAYLSVRDAVNPNGLLPAGALVNTALQAFKTQARNYKTISVQATTSMAGGSWSQGGQR
jgi:hypothetical protein